MLASTRSLFVNDTLLNQNNIHLLNKPKDNKSHFSHSLDFNMLLKIA